MLNKYVLSRLLFSRERSLLLFGLKEFEVDLKRCREATLTQVFNFDFHTSYKVLCNLLLQTYCLCFRFISLFTQSHELLRCFPIKFEQDLPEANLEVLHFLKRDDTGYTALKHLNLDAFNILTFIGLRVTG